MDATHLALGLGLPSLVAGGLYLLWDRRRTRAVIASQHAEITALRAASAAEAVRQRLHFVAVVSHELRVPLDAVMNSLALLDDTMLPPPARALVATARRAGAGLHHLAADILDLSRLDAGRLVLRNANFELPVLLGEVCDMFRTAAAAKGLTMLMAIEADLPETLHGDAGRIRQVLVNLISNAVKYASPGVLSVRATRSARILRLTVADPGPPIPPAQAKTLFQPFTRLEQAEPGPEKGTGLGLAICARLAGVMGGEIGLACEAGGNAFWLSVPLDLAHRTEPVCAQALRRHMRRAAILLVEDVASNRELTAALLRREGHRVDIAENGFVALACAARHPYDLILMDVHMPGIDGIETTSRIRRLPGPAGTVPIVALTGTTLGDDRNSALDAIMDAVLLKPVLPETLTATLRRLVMPWLHDPAAARPAALAPPGILHDALVAALRDGLAPGIFARLMEQCLADMADRLPHLAEAARLDPPSASLRAETHALAGMAGSYGLAQFEALMHNLRLAVDRHDRASINHLVAAASPTLDIGAAALRAATHGG